MKKTIHIVQKHTAPGETVYVCGPTLCGLVEDRELDCTDFEWLKITYAMYGTLDLEVTHEHKFNWCSACINDNRVALILLGSTNI